MTVDTDLHSAVDRVEAERERVDDLIDGLDRFESRVSELPVDADPPGPNGRSPDAPGAGGTPSAAPGPDGHLPDGGVRLRSQGGSPDGCERIRELFAAEVLPHVEADAAMRGLAEMLGRDVAMQVAPASAGPVSPQLIDAVTAASARRRENLRTMQRALDREAAFLDGAISDLDPIVGWLADADEAPLTDLGFDALAERHETLSSHRDRCAELARRRQRQLDETTARGQSAVPHRSLVDSLYDDFPDSHPVLATAVRLRELCGECQRAVRDHLVRRA